MTRSERIIVRLGVAAALLVAVTYAARRTIERTAETFDTYAAGAHIDASRLGVAALLLVFPAFVAGQATRGYLHARGIRKSHFHAIKGGGLALVLVVAAVLVVIGGAS